MQKKAVRLLLAAAALALACSIACGTDPACEGVRCLAGEVCDGRFGACVPGVPRDSGVDPGDGGSGDAGSSSQDRDAGGDGADVGSRDASVSPDAQASKCTPPCSGSTSICDPATSTCKACLRGSVGTEDPGCTGDFPACDTTQSGGRGACVRCTTTRGCWDDLAPFCDTSVYRGKCVACLTDSHCTPKMCDLQSHLCVAKPEDAGASASDDAGVQGLDAGDGQSGDGGEQCIHRRDAGAIPCSGSCGEGFHCAGGQCVLNGGGGAVQVTLRWDQPEDLDLHVDEPTLSGGACEIWYGDANRPTGSSSCGALGSLDLDSNAGCSIDNVDIENIIYRGSAVSKGTYTVRVDYFANCSATTPVPYEVTVRANGATNTYCGSFLPSAADHGGAGSGVVVTSFTVP